MKIDLTAYDFDIEIVYDNDLLDLFNTLLFMTDINDYESATQNSKTDTLCLEPDISFDDWFDSVCETFYRELDLDLKTVQSEALSNEPFMTALEEEFEYLKEFCIDDE
jgi:hypothetical protein